jgi:hypothetical protein
MSEDNQAASGCSDGKADALAAIALVSIAIVTVVYWLSAQS